MLLFKYNCIATSTLRIIFFNDAKIIIFIKTHKFSYQLLSPLQIVELKISAR